MLPRRVVQIILTLSFVVAVSHPTSAGLAQEKKLHPIAAQVKESLKDDAKPFTMLVHIKVKDGMEKPFEIAFAKAIAPTRKEKGCLEYDLNRDVKKANHYLVYERWQNLASLQAHLESAHITALLTEVGDMLDGAPDVRVMIPAGE